MDQTPWAGWKEVRWWLLLSFGIATVMLVGVAVAAHLVPASPGSGQTSRLLDRHGSWLTVGLVLRANMLVLALHFCACSIGAIVGRPHKPLPEKWSHYSRWHREMPNWMTQGALLYAATATLLSIVIQTTALSFVLHDLSAYLDVSPQAIVLRVLPHALPELTGIFLPLALFLIQARRGRLDVLGRWVWQATAIALPLIVGAALIETFISPHLFPMPPMPSQHWPDLLRQLYNLTGH